VHVGVLGVEADDELEDLELQAQREGPRRCDAVDDGYAFDAALIVVGAEGDGLPRLQAPVVADQGRARTAGDGDADVVVVLQVLDAVQGDGDEESAIVDGFEAEALDGGAAHRLDGWEEPRELIVDPRVAVRRRQVGFATALGVAPTALVAVQVETRRDPDGLLAGEPEVAHQRGIAACHWGRFVWLRVGAGVVARVGVGGAAQVGVGAQVEAGFGGLVAAGSREPARQGQGRREARAAAPRLPEVTGSGSRARRWLRTRWQ
jgi:hypothetical protein